MTQNAAFGLFVWLSVYLSVCWQVFCVFAEYHSQINGGHLGGSNISSSNNEQLLLAAWVVPTTVAAFGVHSSSSLNTHTHTHTDGGTASMQIRLFLAGEHTDTHTHTQAPRQSKFKNARQDKHRAAFSVSASLVPRGFSNIPFNTLDLNTLRNFRQNNLHYREIELRLKNNTVIVPKPHGKYDVQFFLSVQSRNSSVLFFFFHSSVIRFLLLFPVSC